jgi:hypothetical protein
LAPDVRSPALGAACDRASEASARKVNIPSSARAFDSEGEDVIGTAHRNKVVLGWEGASPSRRSVASGPVVETFPAASKASTWNL